MLQGHITVMHIPYLFDIRGLSPALWYVVSHISVRVFSACVLI